MADAIRISNCADLSIRSKAKIVVVSATSGTTNALVEICELKGNATQACEDIVQRHLKIAEDLGLKDSEYKTFFDKAISELTKLSKGIELIDEVSPKTRDKILCIGEKLSSALIAHCLSQKSSSPVHLVPATQLIKTDEYFGSATPLYEETRAFVKNTLLKYEQDSIFVTQGFTGSTLQDETTTLGRGGSDFSASLLGWAIDATSIEIWTDVKGVATTDPRICKNAQFINSLSFDEASEMAGFGAKVLHPITLEPAKKSKIPLKVLSTLEPESPGTTICQEPDKSPLVRAINCKRNQTLLTLRTASMLYSHNFLQNIFNVFNSYRISIDSIVTSQISVCMTLDDSTMLNSKLIAELKKMAEVQIEPGYTLVSLSGNHMSKTPELCKELFEVLGRIKTKKGNSVAVNSRMISAGASDHNICIMVNDQNADDVIQNLHDYFLPNYKQSLEAESLEVGK